MAPGLHNRILGALIGGAIGDCLGGPYEGQRGPIAIQPDAPWRLSDDTQLTLATCEAIAATGAVAPAAIAARFAAWFCQGRISGVGASTLKALRDLAVGAHWAVAGRTGERGAGNGAAMRAAPLAFCLDPEVDEHRTLLRDAARITHHNDEAYAGALAVVVAVRAVTAAGWRQGESLATRVGGALPDTTVRDRLHAIGALDPALRPVDVARRFGCSGFVAESVPLAIFAAQRAGALGFAQALYDAVEAGGDTDTVAAMTGQIAGASVGLDNLPVELVRRLPESEVIVATAMAFADVVLARPR